KLPLSKASERHVIQPVLLDPFKLVLALVQCCDQHSLRGFGHPPSPLHGGVMVQDPVRQTPAALGEQLAQEAGDVLLTAGQERQCTDSHLFERLKERVALVLASRILKWEERDPQDDRTRWPAQRRRR